MDEIKESIEYLDIERISRFVRNGEVEQNINKNNRSKNLKETTLTRVVGIIVKMYYEAYADIQKVLVTGIGYQDYLTGFIGGLGEQWKIPVEGNMEDMGRISMVSMVMEKCGMWKFEKEYPALDPIESKLGRLHHAVQKIIEKVDEINSEKTVFTSFKEENKVYIQDMLHESTSSDLYTDEFSNDFADEQPQEISFLTARIYLELLRYLYHCVKASVAEYSKEDKKNKINKLRETMKIVNECKDVKVVFIEMNNKIREYREEVFPKRTKKPMDGKDIKKEEQA